MKRKNYTYCVEYEDFPSCFDPYVQRSNGYEFVTACNKNEAKEKIEGYNRRVTSVTRVNE